MTQWKKLLKSLGLSESESSVYLTSLEMGPASVQDIAKKAGISRVTTYAVIETLAERGLLTWVEKGKKKLFVAESPERLANYFAKRVQEMDATLKEVQASLSDLKLMQRGEKPVVKLFEGREALKAIQDDVIATRPKQAVEFGNLEAIRSFYSLEEREGYLKQYAKIQPKTRTILFTKTPAIITNPASDLIEIPIEQASSRADLFVYDNKVALSTFNAKQISVLIESSELANLFFSLFDYIWKNKNNK